MDSLISKDWDKGVVPESSFYKDVDTRLNNGYAWRLGELENEICRTDNTGDLFLSQKSIIFEPYKLTQQTLDEGVKPVPVSHSNMNVITAHYDYWLVLAATAIKYADTVGVKIPEVKNWRDVLGMYGWDDKITEPKSEESFYDFFTSDYSNKEIISLPDDIDVLEVEEDVFGMIKLTANGDISYLPMIDSEERLVFYINFGSGDAVEFVLNCVKDKYYPSLYFSKDDASHLFKGVVHGIMMGQSRTSPNSLAFMLWQYEHLKAGLSVDKIDMLAFDL